MQNTKTKQHRVGKRQGNIFVFCASTEFVCAHLFAFQSCLKPIKQLLRFSCQFFFIYFLVFINRFIYLFLIFSLRFAFDCANCIRCIWHKISWMVQVIFGHNSFELYTLSLGARRESVSSAQCIGVHVSYSTDETHICICILLEWAEIFELPLGAWTMNITLSEEDLITSRFL